MLLFTKTLCQESCPILYEKIMGTMWTPISHSSWLCVMSPYSIFIPFFHALGLCIPYGAPIGKTSNSLLRHVLLFSLTWIIDHGPLLMSLVPVVEFIVFIIVNIGSSRKIFFHCLQVTSVIHSPELEKKSVFLQESFPSKSPLSLPVLPVFFWIY